MSLKSPLLAIFLAALPTTLFAGRPTIIIDRDPPGPTIIVNDNFTFGANNLGGGDFSFQNETGHSWLGLTVTVSLPGLEPITCGPGPFQTCTIATSPQNGSFLYNIQFGPVERGSGIPNGTLFSIDLNDQGTDPNGSGSWGAGNDFSALATNGAPEPAAWLLTLGGFAATALFLGYRRRLSA